MPTEISGSTGVNKIQDGTVVDADINSSAAIAGSKLVMPAGSVIQVLIVEDSSELSLASATYTDTDLSLSITPSSTSSKILCLWNMHVSHNTAGSGFGVRLVRGSTTIYTSAQIYDTYHNESDNRSRSDYKHLDSPSTTSAITYKVQVGSYGGKAIGVNGEGNQTQLVLMEIAG